MAEKDYDKIWTDIAKKQLLGRKITGVRYLSQEEADEMGWYHRPVVLQLDDGNIVYPSSDDEGNNGGVLFTNDVKNGVLPVMR